MAKRSRLLGSTINERRAPAATLITSLFVAPLLVIIGSALGSGVDLSADAQIAVRNQGYIPYSDAPINYRTGEINDPVAVLQKQLDAGEVTLAYDEQRGYLQSTLDLLKIPASSQTLVFSKTSFQHTHISPDHPRALYYNDDVYVGSVKDGKALEIISFDPMQGAIFYVLDEDKVDKPVFQRAELDCTQCHIAPGTRGIPGVFLQSVHATTTGSLAPRAPFYITDQKSPLNERWGGWYVTGALASATMANAAVAVATSPVDSRAAPAPRELKVFDPPFDASRYLVPTSDDVALLVLGHQTQMHNLVTLLNYQTRIALHSLGDAAPKSFPADASAALETLPEKQRDQIKTPAEQLLRYMLFVKETPLGGLDAKKVVASSAFAREFAAQGVRDSKKRSLRDLDLHDRIFRYPLSYLIYSDSFDALPEPASGYIYHRLLQVLTGADKDPDFAHLTADDRSAILSILLETKKGLPAEWGAYARSRQLQSGKSPAGTGNGK